MRLIGLARLPVDSAVDRIEPDWIGLDGGVVGIQSLTTYWFGKYKHTDYVDEFCKHKQGILNMKY